MCVIFVAEDGVRPTELMLERGAEKNPMGAGIAWRETQKQKDGTKKTVVRWVKGIEDIAEVKKIVAKLPFPFVTHFRVASNGTSLRKAVNHPFPLEPDVRLDLEGVTEHGVLFHNGFWTGWKDKLTNAAINSRLKLPSDSWSDSRGLAWMATHFGLGILELVDEKVVAFGPDFLEMFGGVGGTNQWTDHNGIWCSNMGWNVSTTQVNAPVINDHRRWQRPMSALPAATGQQGGSTEDKEEDTKTSAQAGNTGASANGQPGGAARQVGFRGTGGNADRPDGAGSRGGDQQEAVQAAFTEVEGGGATVTVEINEKGDDAALARRFLCGISPRAMAVVRDTISDDPTPRRCADCGSQKAGVITDGVRHCWQCYYSDKHKERRAMAARGATTVMDNEPPIAAAPEGDGAGSEGAPAGSPPPSLHRKCETCKDRYGVAMTAGGARWICSQCWVKSDRPRLLNRTLENTWTRMANRNQNLTSSVDAERERRRGLAAQGITVVGSM